MDKNKQLRDTETCAWCWQDKKVFERIAEYYESKKECAATCTLVYIVLTKVASDQSSKAEAWVTVRVIAKLAFKSRSTVKKYLKDLVTMGLVGIKHNRSYGSKCFGANTWLLYSV